MSHMGLVLLGAAAAVPLAINGAILTMLADGLSAGLLVLLAAAIIERANTSSLRAMGGLAGRMNRGTILWVLAALAAAGFPGLAAFAAQPLFGLGAYPAHRPPPPWPRWAWLWWAAGLCGTTSEIFFVPA